MSDPLCTCHLEPGFLVASNPDERNGRPEWVVIDAECYEVSLHHEERDARLVAAALNEFTTTGRMECCVIHHQYRGAVEFPWRSVAEKS